jgi:hypothetical protein
VVEGNREGAALGGIGSNATFKLTRLMPSDTLTFTLYVLLKIGIQRKPPVKVLRVEFCGPYCIEYRRGRFFGSNAEKDKLTRIWGAK